MIETSAVLVPLLYNKVDLPDGVDPNEQRGLVETAFTTGWRVRFHKIFKHNNVVYERYIFEREVK